MKVKLYEAKWLHHISGSLASEFHKAIEEGNIEAVKSNSIALLEKCKEFFDQEEQDYVIYEIEDLIESFTDVEEDEDEVDFLLDKLYDFCDGYNIFIDVVEEAPAEEPVVEPEVHEEPMEEPKETEVVEIKPEEE